MVHILCEDEDYIEAAKFYAEKLNIPDGTIIGIKLYNCMDLAGYCERHEDTVLPYYLIGLDTTVFEGEDPPMAVLAHEMVHVMQYATGQLVDHGTYCSWHGKKFDDFDANSEEYFFSPWEVEAFGMQVGLYRLYLREFEQ